MKARPLNARLRTERGSRGCLKLRREGFIPANLYGSVTTDGAKKSHNVQLAVSAYELSQLIDQHAQLLEVSFDSRKELVQVVEVQRDTFGDDILHVDLHMIDMHHAITAEVELVFKGEAKGVKAGGHLEVELRSLEVEALPGDMPAEIVVRVDDLDLEQAIHVREIPTPGTWKITADPDLVVVQVVAPVSEEEAEAAAPSEPELIRKEKTEEEGKD